ncbi:hypothetical protein [Streptomyces sp. A1547]|uniref:hypothetical protein n=1 Tax=Streptomyces sp. A1547 TaxID=2563105 RepID=UPI00109ECC12|nr:hypothetical protein [Streptomyces sp. A1547]THA30647.1 hypothetical protein E6W17_37180 [Streptomyces sp. A1547]
MLILVIVSGLVMSAAYSAVNARHVGDMSTGVPCKEAVEFAMAELPERATNAECENYGVMDRSYKGTWRMPQADVDTWVTRYFPDHEPPPAPGIPSECEVDLCVTVHRDPMAETTKGAYDIALDIHFTPDGTAHVSYSSTDY